MDNNITITKEQLKQLLNEAYNEGYDYRGVIEKEGIFSYDNDAKNEALMKVVLSSGLVEIFDVE